MKKLNILIVAFLLFVCGCANHYIKQENYSATDRIYMLCYIATDEQIDEMLNSPVLQHAMVYELFWEVNDPTPLTPQNESRELYEYTIEWCDEQFDGCAGKGWRSDMSKVIMLWGFPDNIYYEPLPFEFIMGYQVWEYYLHNRRLVFAERYVDCYYLQNIPGELLRWF